MCYVPYLLTLLTILRYQSAYPLFLQSVIHNSDYKLLIDAINVLIVINVVLPINVIFIIGTIFFGCAVTTFVPKFQFENELRPPLSGI
jgi:hypothetical protein